MSNSILQYVFYLVILVALAIPLGKYISKVMNGEKVFLSKIMLPVENFIYKVLKIKKDEEMGFKKYAISALAFSAFGLIFLFVIQCAQKFLPLNPEGISGMSWDLSFNTAASFVTNTNWQAYSGESQLSYLSQALGLTVQNFTSAATGMAVLYALVRGLMKVKSKGLGNFFVDVTRSILYVLIPLSLVVTIGIASQGVVQTFKGHEEVSLLEPVAVTTEGEIIENAKIQDNKVYVNGEQIKDAEVVTKQIVPLGMAASQVAIKQLGTNGGGYYGVNSAHPLENPTPFSSMLEMLSLLLIPVALCFAFGRDIKNKKQGIAIFMAMFILLVGFMGITAYSEHASTPAFTSNPAVSTSVDGQIGNMEGKETRFGIASSVTWASWTTAASNGSVNSMHDSYTPIGGMIPMLQMQLGEVVFGGVGCGLYGMLGFAILAVFVAGLMVGRTPEFLGKKIEPFEMRMAVLVCLATPIAILIGSFLATILPSTADSLNNAGAHGLSEVIYAFSSAGGNNGSAFAGFNANTPFLNVNLGFVMLFARFVQMTACLAIAGSLAKKKKIAVTAGTLSTSNAMFVFLLVLMVLIVGALSFFPALALGPIAEFFEMII
ncbi:potassium-transporting ATPase subunit KdpA [Anaerofustis stercorihominis]|uniref:potassium-transporting ATPase subunit KdpA n=1 Tax=Anaerofustis stercorihominis TaxID=214853 RepID=UPI00210A1C48|nr:potassium-transporting ATPase subunit KdpA [Anaerofustis stercorihominis]MCQ4795173.1 potassium-transporting ATPase subunit KdpA [Anaerofustis stercorihominis]